MRTYTSIAELSVDVRVTVVNVLVRFEHDVGGTVPAVCWPAAVEQLRAREPDKVLAPPKTKEKPYGFVVMGS
jgi:hypothetical protein